MYETLFIIGIVCAVIGGGFLIASIAMFFGFNIPALRKDSSGRLEQRQIEEIRRNSSAAVSQRGKVNVFEELEKKAKVKKNNTHSLNVGPTTAPQKRRLVDSGTTILNQTAKNVNPNFIIEKNIMFVSTNEVM